MPKSKLDHPLCELTKILRGQKCFVLMAPWTGILPRSWTQRTGKSKSVILTHLPSRKISFWIAGESCRILQVLGARISTGNWSAVSSVWSDHIVLAEIQSPYLRGPMQPKRHSAALMVPTTSGLGCYRTDATMVSEEPGIQHIGIDLTNDCLHPCF